LCFAAHPETIHMHGSSVYGVLELEDSRFNTFAMAEETRQFETGSFVHSYHVCWMLVIGEKLVCERGEGNPRDRYAVAVKKLVTQYATCHVTFQCFVCCL